MKKTLALLMMAGTFSMADMIAGGEINLGYYSHAPSGNLAYKGTSIDLEDDLQFGNEADFFAKAYIEHPIPVLPNIRVAYADFSHAGDGKINNTFTFGNKSFAQGLNVDSTFDLKMYDLTLYYELLDNWVSLDAGVNVKYIDGSVSVKSGSLSEATDFQVPIPMVYMKARFDVPTTDLTFQVEGDYIGYSGNTLYEVEAGVRYTFLLGLGVEVGYKAMKIKIDDVDDFTMNTDFSGAYGKLVWDF